MPPIAVVSITALAVLLTIGALVYLVILPAERANAERAAVALREEEAERGGSETVCSQGSGERDETLP